jgi:hypothetical protein
MSYYILPRVINSIQIKPKIQQNEIETYISHSLFNYYNKMKTQLNHIEFDLSFNKQLLMQIVNPFEFIFSKIPGSKFSVSKLKTQTSIFYDILEIINMLNIFDNYKNNNLNFITISSSYEDINSCYELFRENNSDIIENHTEFNNNLYEGNNNKYDIIFYEIEQIMYCNLNNYILRLIDIVLLILKQQSNNGITIIKIGYSFHKPVIDILYLLSSIYQKVYIIKPNTSNIIQYDKFIVCKNFISHDHTSQIYNYYLTTLMDLKNQYLNYPDKNIAYIIDIDIPYYYINKIDDINNIIGQQQLESIDQVINIYKNKNKDDKIESLKRVNIQKSVNWCEKMKIPYNKFSEKPNIFLPIVNEIIYNEEAEAEILNEEEVEILNEEEEVEILDEEEEIDYKENK